MRLSFALALLLFAAPAFAEKEWYQHYYDAERLIGAGKCPEALKSLQEAVRLRPGSDLNVRTYGMDFVPSYVPYYWQGVCHQTLGDNNAAIRFFNLEEDRGAIRKSRLYPELIRLRTQADAAERTRVGRQARAELDRLLKEAQELARARKFEEALTKLASAEPLAKALDPVAQRTVADAVEAIRREEQERAESTQRAHRLDQTLQEAARLLEEGKPTEAVVSFDRALAIDPKNAKALEGKREAQELIRATSSAEALRESFRQGQAFLDAGEYEKAIPPLTDAAADPSNAAARELLARALKVVEGTRAQKELRAQIEALIAKGEKLLASGKNAEAQVSLESAFRLDPGNARAKERLAEAERRTSADVAARILRNQSPLLIVIEPPREETAVPGGLVVAGTTVAVIGTATDDRGMGKVEFRIGDRLVAEEVPFPGLDDPDARRTLSFQRRFPLEQGQNAITITAVDDEGLSRRETLVVTRKLRFHESAWFVPSVAVSSMGLIGAGLAVQGLRRRRAVRRRFNPYIAGAPVLEDHMFFGRQKLMARLLNVLHHNSLMITGERRIGKTTFLYRLKKVLETDEGTDYRFFPVFIDLQGVPETQFFAALMADVADALSLSADTRGAMRFRPGVERYDGRDFSHDLQRVIEELKARTNRKVKLALLIDEVDVLNGYSESVNQRLRSIFMKTFSESLVAVMSGVGIKRIWKSEVSPWYNFFDEVELSAFTREEAEELVKTPVEGFFRYEPAALERILELSRLRPYLIQKFCIHAVNHMLEQGRSTITVDDVSAVRETVLVETDEEDAPPLGAAEGRRAPLVS
jgi:tetratricopeptide (TPR) repeat protein